MGPISILHRVYSSVLYSVFNWYVYLICEYVRWVANEDSVLFYSTLYVGWKGSREGGISLGEHVESLLPQ